MNLNSNKIPGFTITELLVTLALTSLAITLSYGTLTYIQKLFYNYRKQNRFINDYTAFKRKMDQEALFCDLLIREDGRHFTIRRDSLELQLEVGEKNILLKQADHCDTFHIAASNLKTEFELMRNPAWSDRLVRSLSFETEFTKQRFNFYFYKNYDAAVKLELDQED